MPVITQNLNSFMLSPTFSVDDNLCGGWVYVRVGGPLSLLFWSNATNYGIRGVKSSTTLNIITRVHFDKNVFTNSLRNVSADGDWNRNSHLNRIRMQFEWKLGRNCRIIIIYWTSSSPSLMFLHAFSSRSHCGVEKKEQIFHILNYKSRRRRRRGKTSMENCWGSSRPLFLGYNFKRESYYDDRTKSCSDFIYLFIEHYCALESLRMDHILSSSLTRYVVCNDIFNWN